MRSLQIAKGDLWLYTQCGLVDIFGLGAATMVGTTLTSRLQVKTFDVFDGVQPGGVRLFGGRPQYLRMDSCGLQMVVVPANESIRVI